jgi:hypothetical protein
MFEIQFTSLCIKENKLCCWQKVQTPQLRYKWSTFVCSLYVIHMLTIYENKIKNFQTLSFELFEILKIME